MGEQPNWMNLAKVLAEKVTLSLRDEKNRKDFEAWYKARYGKDYVWKHI